MSKILLLLFAGLFVLTYTVNAQSWEVGATVGASGYIGDFNPNNPLKFTDPVYGLFLKRNFDPYFSLKLGVSHGTISGYDSQSSNQQMQNRNLSFFTNLDETSLIGELNFFSYIPLVGKNIFTPYIFAGIGTVSYTPQTTYNGEDYDLRALMTEGQQKPYKESAIAVPFGVGVKYNITGQWNIILDLGYRYTNTGYLDDVYGAYPNKTVLTTDIARILSDRSGEINGNYIGSAGSQRGNYRNDTYMFLGFTVSYTFLSSKCYSFR
ncbi:type IX secretion system protein PorG [Mucilaginibacter gracilis]|nr:DUF6089 family protein [Mucilaginibacter gracilis]